MPDKSLPAWECGLKLYYVSPADADFAVTPCVGVWIEISAYLPKLDSVLSHSLRGSVD